MSRHVYERFLRHCTSYSLCAPWRNLDVPPDCKLCPARGTAVLADLADEFLEAALVKAGIAKNLADGLILHSAVTGADQGIIALRTAPNESAFGLITSAGTLSRSGSNAFVSLHDYSTQERLRQRGNVLYVAFSIEDLIVLRSLEYPAISAEDLLPFTAVRLREVIDLIGGAIPGPCGSACEVMEEPALPAGIDEARGQASAEAIPENRDVCDDVEEVRGEGNGEGEEREGAGPAVINNPAATKAAGHEGMELVLVGWSPAALSTAFPEACGLLLARLRQAEHYLAADFSGVGVWRPNARELEGIRYCLEMDALQEGRQLVDQSASQSVYALERVSDDNSGGDARPIGYIEALRNLEIQIRRCEHKPDHAGVDQAADDFHDATDRELISPLLEIAFAGGNAMKRNVGVVAAQLARIIHDSAPYINVLSDGKPHPNRSRQRQNDVTIFLKMVNQFERICREFVK